MYFLLSSFFFHQPNYRFYISDWKLVGVADPTLSLPTDSVFVPGLNPMDCHHNKIFVTRYPCLTYDDAKLVTLVTCHKPREMTDDKWNFLQSLPFGFIVFGKSSHSELSLPEQIGDGDLDGDNYHVLWDYKMIESLISAEESNVAVAKQDNETMEVDGKYYDFTFQAGQGNFQDATILGKVDDGTYNVQIGDETRILEEEEIMGTKDEVVAIVGHNRCDLRVQWKLKDGSTQVTTEKRSALRKEIPKMIANYALENKLLDTPGWKWAKRELRETYMQKVVGHDVKDQAYSFTVVFDDGSTETLTFDELKKDAPDLLLPYATDHDLLIEWRNEYTAAKGENWFCISQEHNAKLRLLRDQVTLKQQFYSRQRKMREKGDTEAAEYFAAAYKKALDLRKHNGQIELPYHLIKYVNKDLQHYVSHI